MRLKLTVYTDKLPINCQMLFLGMIKEALKNSDTSFYRNMFYYGDKINKRTKNFCYGAVFRNFDINDEQITLKDGKSELFLSSPDYNFVLNFYNGLLSLKEFKYRDYTVKLGKIFILPEKKIDNSLQVFKTISPICVKNSKGKWLELEDENFSKELNYIADKILNNFREVGLKEKLEFQPIKMKRRVVKLADDFSLPQKKFYYVNSYVGVFSLKGNKQDLNDLYQLGLSFRRSEGFGLIEVV